MAGSAGYPAAGPARQQQHEAGERAPAAICATQANRQDGTAAAARLPVPAVRPPAIPAHICQAASPRSARGGTPPIHVAGDASRCARGALGRARVDQAPALALQRFAPAFCVAIRWPAPGSGFIGDRDCTALHLRSGLMASNDTARFPKAAVSVLRQSRACSFDRLRIARIELNLRSASPRWRQAGSSHRVEHLPDIGPGASASSAPGFRVTQPFQGIALPKSMTTLRPTGLRHRANRRVCRRRSASRGFQVGGVSHQCRR